MHVAQTLDLCIRGNLIPIRVAGADAGAFFKFWRLSKPYQPHLLGSSLQILPQFFGSSSIVKQEAEVGLVRIRQISNVRIRITWIV